MKHNILSLFLIFPCLALFNCAKKIDISVISEDESKGTIISAPTNATAGDRIVLQAKPKDNFLFTGWFTKENDNLFFESDDLTFVYTVPNHNVTMVAAFEEWSTQSFNFIFDDKNNTWTISDFHGTGDKLDVLIPLTHHKYPVTKIASRTFYGKNNVQSIKVTNNIERIDKEAFAAITNKCDLYLPLSLESVGERICDGWDIENRQTIHINKNSLKESGFTTWLWKLEENGTTGKFKDITENDGKSGSNGYLIILDNN